MPRDKDVTHLYDLPCYPDDRAMKNRRLSVDIHKDFCGDPGYHVFIGGGGVGTFDTMNEAQDAVHRLVGDRLQYFVDARRAEYEYALGRLTQWNTTPAQFSPID